MNKIHTMYPNSYHLAMWLHFDPYMAKMFKEHVKMNIDLVKENKRKKDKDLWLVLPGHEVWRRAAFSASVRELNTPFWRNLLQNAFHKEQEWDIRISWRFPATNYTVS